MFFSSCSKLWNIQFKILAYLNLIIVSNLANRTGNYSSSTQCIIKHSSLDFLWKNLWEKCACILCVIFQEILYFTQHKNLAKVIWPSKNVLSSNLWVSMPEMCCRGHVGSTKIVCITLQLSYTSQKPLVFCSKYTRHLIHKSPWHRRRQWMFDWKYSLLTWLLKWTVHKMKEFLDP